MSHFSRAKTFGLWSDPVEEAYQWDRPYVLDDSAARTHFSMEPTPRV